jgi:hypothetical protein
MTSRLLILAVCAATILAACGLPGAQPPQAPPPGDVVWPAPGNPLELAVNAGLKPETKERVLFHVHAHLDIFIDGRSVLVPAGIGINVLDPAVHHGEWNGNPQYGGITECAQPCISPLHTHDVSGVIHTESGFTTTNRLGQFFTEWGVAFGGACVGQYCAPATQIAVYVDGKKLSGNVSDIPLSIGKEIAIVIGSPPKQIPDSFPNWTPG